MARQTRKEKRQEARQQRRRNFLGRIFLGFALIVAVAFWRWTISPSSTPASSVASADAVVMFVGGRGERLLQAAELMNAGVADTLVIPNGTVEGWPDANRFCREQVPNIRVICPTPYPDDTRGEARVIAELAQVEGWDRLVMVTSEYHVSRARLKLKRCFDGELTTVAAKEADSLATAAGRNVREMLGHIEARLFERGC